MNVQSSFGFVNVEPAIPGAYMVSAVLKEKSNLMPTRDIDTRNSVFPTACLDDGNGDVRILRQSGGIV